MQYSKLSILMPVFNERATIETIVDEVLAAPLPGGMERELIIVDDASRDGTRETLQALAAAGDTRIRVLYHETNRGKGAAVSTALQAATGDVCIVQDADLEYDPRDYSRMLRPILEGNADVVYGSRFLASEYRRVLYFWHTLGNRLLTAVSNVATNLNLTDMLTCYKAAKSSLLQSIPIRCARFGWEAEVTAKFAKRNCSIYEVPISYRGRTYEQGKKAIWIDGLRVLGAIVTFKFWDDLYRERYGHAILQRLEQTRQMNRWVFRSIQPHVGEDVLEVGAGIGNLTQFLIPRRRLFATDIDPMYLDLLRNRFGTLKGVAIRTLDLERAEDFTPLPRDFDTVVCLNVLEHVDREMDALQNIASVLAPGGRAILLVPYGRWLFGRLDQILEHKRRYSAEDLRQKCSDAGLQVESTRSFNRIGILGWWLNSVVLRRTTFGKFQLKVYDSLIPLWRLLDRLPLGPGLSIIAVARKPEPALDSQPAGE